MLPHYHFPASTELNRHLPKEAFYQRLNPTTALKQAFVVQVQEIVWHNKLAANTLNIVASGDYPELQVFDIELKPGVTELDVAVLRAIDSLVIFPIYYRLTRNINNTSQLQYLLAYKLSLGGSLEKVKLVRYFASPWMSIPSEDHLLPLPLALDTTQLYRQLLQPFIKLQARVGEPLMAWMARLEDVAKLETRISRLHSQLQREKQFNRKMGLNRELNESKHALQVLLATND